VSSVLVKYKYLIVYILIRSSLSNIFKTVRIYKACVTRLHNQLIRLKLDRFNLKITELTHEYSVSISQET